MLSLRDPVRRTSPSTWRLLTLVELRMSLGGFRAESRIVLGKAYYYLSLCMCEYVYPCVRWLVGGQFAFTIHPIGELSSEYPHRRRLNY